ERIGGNWTDVFPAHGAEHSQALSRACRTWTGGRTIPAPGPGAREDDIRCRARSYERMVQLPSCWTQGCLAEGAGRVRPAWAASAGLPQRPELSESAAA